MSTTSDGGGGSIECPTCGRDDFDDESGMKVHHSVAHGESIAGVEAECANCGVTFRAEPNEVEQSENVFCEKECYSEWQTQNTSGESHPRWAGRVEKTCVNCGETVVKEPWEIEDSEHTFCDKDCHGEWLSDNVVGEDHHCYRPESHKTTACNYCGEEFEYDTYQNEGKYCSHSCRGKDKKGEEHPNFDPEIHRTSTCEYCGEKIIYSTNHSDGKYCGPSCQMKDATGRDHPQWSGRVEKECPVCGDVFQVVPSISERRTTCSRGCYAEYLSEGGRFPYGPGFSEVKKEAVRERDGRECVDCGLSEQAHLEEAGHRLHVHHLKKAREIDDPEERNGMENLVSLCQSCHLGKWEQMYPLQPDINADTLAD